jgi:hypothetical protein
MNLPDVNRDLGPNPTPRQQLRHEPNDRPDWANAFGFCIDCERRYGSADWKLIWCNPCQKFHTCCPHCESPLEFHCVECGAKLTGPDGELWCTAHSESQGWGDEADD